MDQTRHPIEGAVIHAYAGNILGASLQQRDSAVADRSGKAMISRKRVWHYFVLFVPDAEAPEVYGFCVDARGFAPLGNIMEDRTGESIEAPLLASPVTARCPGSLDTYQLKRGRVAAPAAYPR